MEVAEAHLLHLLSGNVGPPPQVWGVQWCPLDASVQEANLEAPGKHAFVSYGKQHIKVWTAGGLDFEDVWMAVALLYGDVERSDYDVYCCGFLPGGSLVTGCASGKLMLWHGGACVAQVWLTLRFRVRPPDLP